MAGWWDVGLLDLGTVACSDDEMVGWYGWWRRWRLLEMFRMVGCSDGLAVGWWHGEMIG